MLTQKQIAMKLGISQITVSRVINNHPSVKPAMRERVMRALGKGYALNTNARNLVLGRSGRLALVIPGEDAFNSPFLPQVLAGIALETRHRHYSAFFLDMQGLAQPGEVGADLRGADAAIIFNFSMMRPFLKPLLRAMNDAGQPYVLVQSHGGGKGPVLSVDNAQGGELAVKHLLELGHRRIAFIGRVGSSESRERRLGYERALRGAGLDIRPEWLFIAERDTGLEKLACYMRSAGRQRPTALLAYSDGLAVALIYELLKCGLRVPDDISLVGFNDFKPFATMVKPHLTTVHQPLRELGAAAVQMVLDGQSSAKSKRLLPTTLVTRDSALCFARSGRAVSIMAK